MTDVSRLRKRPLEADAAASGRAANEIDIAACATISYSSEDPAHPVEHLLDGHSGPGATRWMSARPDTLEHIVVEFDRPQAISRLVYEVEPARWPVSAPSSLAATCSVRSAARGRMKAGRAGGATIYTDQRRHQGTSRGSPR